MTKQVIFSGAPSQVINLPSVLKGAAVVLLIGAIHWYASNHFTVHWSLAFAQMAAVMIACGVPFLKTAFTEIVIDTERITWTQGILSRRSSTLELSSISGVTLAYPWWQRVFGTGTIFMETLDPAHPVRRLPGIRNAEQLRRQLDEAAHARRDPKQAASGPSGRPDAQHRADPEPA